MLFWTFVLVTICVVTGNGAHIPGSKLPKWISACYRDDPKFEECAVKNGQQVIPRLVQGERRIQLPVLDPFEITSIKLDRQVTNLGLDISMWDVTIVGLKDAVLTSLPADFVAHKFATTVQIPRLEISCTYNVSGKILFLPITGSGPGNLTLKDVTAKFLLEYYLVKNPTDGKEYMALKDASLSFDTKRLYIKLSNLFNGDKLLGNTMNQFLNDNWKELIASIGPVFSDALFQVFVKIFNSIAGQIPYDDVVPLKGTA